MLILDPHNAQIEYMPQSEHILGSSSFFNSEGQDFLSITSDFPELTLLIAFENATWCSDNEGRSREVSW